MEDGSCHGMIIELLSDLGVRKPKFAFLYFFSSLNYCFHFYAKITTVKVKQNARNANK